MKPPALNPATRGRTATAIRFATRDTALLIPDATPAWPESTAANAVAVTGATTSDSPKPNTTTAGSTALMYRSPGSMAAINSTPAAISNGPIVNGVRGPMRRASMPARADSSSIRPVIGNDANPAEVGL